jgi:hypothetical protein
MHLEHALLHQLRHPLRYWSQIGLGCAATTRDTGVSAPQDMRASKTAVMCCGPPTVARAAGSAAGGRP